MSDFGFEYYIGVLALHLHMIHEMSKTSKAHGQEGGYDIGTRMMPIMGELKYS